nr:uncharacterized protein LOC113693186 [Coffea arabica]
MEEEIHAIETNDTWELTSLPTGDILKKFKMDTTKSIMTLVEEKLSLIKKGAVNLTHFKSLVGNLRFMKNSHQSHLQAAKRIFRYIRDTRSDGIFYSENDIVELFGYTVIGQVDPTKIYCDSKSTIELSKNPVLHGRSKHINIKYHFIRELVRKRDIEVDYYRTEEQMVDIFFKALKT